MLKNIINILERFNKLHYLNKIIKLFPKNYKDGKGNNLFHYCAEYQYDIVFECALNNQADINAKNKLGYIPLQELLKCSFVYEDISKYEIKDIQNAYFYNCNINFLKKMLDCGANVNYIMEQDFNSTNVKIGRSNNLETPIELLISIFWKSWEANNNLKREVSFLDKEDLSKIIEEELTKSLENYNETFKILLKHNANLNVILKDNAPENESTASWYIDDKQIISLFFIKFIDKNIDIDVLRPIVLNDKMDYSLCDNTGNNLFHILLGRISSKYLLLDKNVIISFLNDIFNMPNFDEKYLNFINDNGINPLECLKKDSIELRSDIESILLKKQLSKSLKKSAPIRKKIDKV